MENTEQTSNQWVCVIGGAKLKLHLLQVHLLSVNTMFYFQIGNRSDFASSLITISNNKIMYWYTSIIRLPWVYLMYFVQCLIIRQCLAEDIICIMHVIMLFRTFFQLQYFYLRSASIQNVSKFRSTMSTNRPPSLCPTLGAPRQ